MKNCYYVARSLSIGVIVLSLFISCRDSQKEKSELSKKAVDKANQAQPKTILSKEFNDYWYSGEAEISSYKLEQARYGEIRDGHAVLIFVTEDFLPDTQVKADNYSKDNSSVLKLNATKNFNTGIYPYSIMQSTFYPVFNNGHALKISTSVQEWCGQVYTQINNRETFEVTSHSYFEKEADQSYNLSKSWTENELWTKLRIDPKSLPTGTIEIIPSIEYTRLKHIEIKRYKAVASLDNSNYYLVYPDLNRTLKINYNPVFPYDILGWEETSTSGFGDSAKTLTTKATKLETVKSAYWTKNSNKDEHFREKLKLQ